MLIILTPLSLWRWVGGEVKAQSWQSFHKMGGSAFDNNNSNPDEKVNDIVTDSEGNCYYYQTRCHPFYGTIARIGL